MRGDVKVCKFRDENFSLKTGFSKQSQNITDLITYLESRTLLCAVRALTSFHFNVFFKKGLICLASASYHLQP